MDPLCEVLARPVALDPAFARLWLALPAADRRAALAAPGTPRVSGGGGRGVAVIPVRGVLWRDALGHLGALLHAARTDPTVRAIVLDIDSPGGSVYGVSELAAQIRETRAVKPVIAAVSALGASAAYWLASQATTVVAAPSAEVGSIGVFTLHLDVSRALEAGGITPTFLFAGPRKIDGNPLQPLSPAAASQLQAGVDRYYRAFTGDVAAGRRVSLATAQGPQFGAGALLGAAEALRAGLVDRLGTLPAVLEDLARGGARASSVPAMRARLLALARPPLRHWRVS